MSDTATDALARKDKAGYNLTSLMVGSEGTLGIFTRILLTLGILDGGKPRPYFNNVSILATTISSAAVGFSA